MNESYPKREMDLKLEAINTKIETSDREVKVELKQHQETHEEILKKMKEGFDGVYNRQDFTNGKIRKITIALVATGAFVVGLGVKEINTVLKFFV